MSEVELDSEPVTPAPEEQQLTLLFVDDEANILSALKRLFRPHGYRIFTAESGRAALDILAQESIDLVVSDMRMPEMTGAQILEEVRSRWPETVRILLTGYADIGSTIDAINKGQIYRYISKPWDDNDITITVRQALERKNLEKEKARLELLTVRQNEELKALNAGLEVTVKARTEEIRQTMGFLEMANKKLKEGFLTSIKVFANLIELREKNIAGHSRRVAEMARSLARKLEMSENEVQDVFVAGLLHDIGKIGLSDQLLTKSFVVLAGEERNEVMRHPVTGQAALMGLEQLHGAAKLIRSHHERYDGMGYPDGLVGLAIPMGARVLAVANDFDAVQIGTLLSKRLTASEAVAYIHDGRGKRYDPAVVEVFNAMQGNVTVAPAEIEVKSPQLKSGMVLSRDLLSHEGVMLLSREHVLDVVVIEQIRNFEKSSGRGMTLHIHAKKRG